jgi:hypothetical protein
MVRGDRARSRPRPVDRDLYVIADDPAARHVLVSSVNSAAPQSATTYHSHPRSLTTYLSRRRSAAAASFHCRRGRRFESVC